MKVWQLRYETG